MPSRSEDNGQTRGVSVALCGPDGVGKSTVANRLGDFLPGSTLHIHHRPGVLPQPDDDGRDFTKPYHKPPRSLPMSILKSIYVLVDWWLGWLFVIWPRVRRGDSVVIQRPWLDLIVDPARYRLSVGPRFLRSLGRLIPDPDLTVLLNAPSDVVQARKRELTVSEFDDRARAWRETVTSVGRVEVVDASQSIDDVVQSVLAALGEARVGRRSHFSARGGKWILPRHPRMAVSEGLRLYHPMDRRTGAFLSMARTGAELGMGRFTPSTTPPRELRAVLRPWLSNDGTFAARRLRGGRRWFVVTLDREGKPEHALKIGLSDSDQAAIEAEKETIRLVAPLVQEPLATPHLSEAPTGVLAMRPVRWETRPDMAHLPVPVAASLGALFKSATGDSTLGRVHGDLAPWNLLGDGHHWVLVDWEASTESGRPFHDLFHWAVQSHSLLSTPDAEEIIDGLITLRGNLGAAIMAFASAAGIDPGLAMTEFGPYLRASEPQSDTSEAKLATAVSRRRQLGEAWRQAYGPGGA